MYATHSRARRWPLAFTLGTIVTAVLAACADRPTEPKFRAPLTPNAEVGDPHTVTNTNDNGIGSLRWVLGYTTGGETIRFDPTLAGQTINVDSALTILYPVTIEGPAGSGLTINAGGKGRLFDPRTRDTITLRNLSLTGGNGGQGSGGVMQGPPEVVLENTAVYGNKGNSYAAIDVVKLTLINSTVSGNSSTTTSATAAVFAYTQVTVISSTVAHNATGGVSSTGLVLRNAVISNNTNNNCAVNPLAITREGTNLSDDDSCGGPSEILIADPKLGPLADNGGPTMTHALLAGSPAINAGSGCTVQVDQRYAPRDAQCDLGAYEFADFTTVTLTIDPNALVKQATGAAFVTGTITCSRPESFTLGVILTQEQKAGKTPTKVHAHSDVPVECSTNTRAFSAAMMLEEGAFQNGSAVAEVRTLDAEPWITPAATTANVKLIRGR